MAGGVLEVVALLALCLLWAAQEGKSYKPFVMHDTL